MDGGVAVSATLTDIVENSEVVGKTAQLPYLQTANLVEVIWSFTIDSVEYQEVESYGVVSPYLTIREIKKIWPQATTEEAHEVESVVRHIINAHCGQAFGFAPNKTIIVEAHGESALALPERLINLTGVSTRTAVLDPNAFIIVSDGWYLKKAWSDVLSTIEDDSTYWSDTSHGEVIVAPPRSNVEKKPTKWRDDYPFTLTGDWGYKEIPDSVKEAAKLLASDYSCREASYRDKYLESMTTADWRLQFNSRSWDYTGNVRADQLLAEFVLLPWAVI